MKSKKHQSSQLEKKASIRLDSHRKIKNKMKLFETSQLEYISEQPPSLKESCQNSKLKSAGKFEQEMS